MDRYVFAFLETALEPEAVIRESMSSISQHARRCHYCLMLREKRKSECCRLSPAPSRLHEHHWLRDRTAKYIVRVLDMHVGASYCQLPSVCEGCSARVHYGQSFEPGSFQHTCLQCRRQYQDGDPFSKFCSRSCLYRRRASDREKRIAGIRKYATMNRLEGPLQANARARLESMARDNAYGSEIRTIAMSALAELESKNDG